MADMSTTSSNQYPPTAEQQAAIDIFATGQDMVIEAGAGTGKTSTLVFLAEHGARHGRRGQFLAFNKGIVEESKGRFPGSCDARTIHSLAFRAVMGSRPALKNRLNSKRLPRSTEARILDIQDIAIQVGIGQFRQNKRLRAELLVAYVMQGVERFCQSDSPEIEAWHFPTIEGIDEIDDRGSHRGSNNRRLAKDLVPAMERAWADLTSDIGRLRFTHSVYLKLWELSSPVVGTDYILFDEAQDVSGVMRSIVLQQQGRSQLVFVGDSQQEIYGFTGAQNAMSYLEGPRTYLTQSFRFGPAVAEVANRVLDRIPGAELRLVGFDRIDSKIAKVEHADAVLCRTNAKAINVALTAMAEGLSVQIADSLKRNVISFAKAAFELKQHGSTDHPELAPFDSWASVKHYVEEDPAGGDLKLLVDLVEDFGAEFIIAELAHTVTSGADLTVSTAHTSKGLEWNTVRLADDFVRESGDLSTEEKRLLYVAVTRAKFVLDCYSVPMTLAGPTHSHAPAPALPAAPTVEVDVDVIEVEVIEVAELAEIIPAAVNPVDPAEAALVALIDAGYFADEDEPIDSSPVTEPTPVTWADVENGDIVDHPTYGRVRITTIRNREGLRRAVAKRVGHHGDVLIDEPPTGTAQLVKRSETAGVS